MNKTEKVILFGLGVFLGFFALQDSALAREFTSAANSAKSQFTTIAKSLSIVGIVAGGGIMQIPGAKELGKKIAVSGAVGTAVVFGATGFESLLRNIFG